MGKKDQRINEILRLIKYNKKMDLKDIAQNFNVSEMTIRRDLDILLSSNLVSNIHGTIIYNEQSIIENDPNKYLVIQQKGIRDDEKERIAKEAAKLIDPGDSIIIDIGTTTSKIVKFLPNNYPISCICFTANALIEAIKKNFDRLFIGGGCYHPNSQMFESSEITLMLRNLRASKVFISAAGVSEDLGITCINQYEVETKLSSIANSKTRILLVDSSKFGVVRNGYFADLSDIHIIVTDSGISDTWIDIIRAKGIELRIV